MIPPPSPKTPRFSVFERVYLLGIWTPLTILTVLLKILRVRYRDEIYSWAHAIDLCRSDLFLTLSLGLLGFIFLKSFQRQTLPFIALQIFAAAFLTIELIAHQFYMSTGTVLDYYLIRLAIHEFSETWWIIQSEASVETLSAIALFSTSLAILPWLWIKRKIPADSTRPHPSKTRTIFYLSAALLLLFGATRPPLLEHHVAFARAASIHTFWSATYPTNDIEGNDTQRPSLMNIQLQAKTQQRTPKNIALIILESTRASSTSVYNDALQTTPFLQQLAARSLVAEHAYAIVPHTSKALVAMLCGIEPDLNMTAIEALPGGIPTRCLADLLARQGYQTAFFQSATEFFENRRQLVENMGYHFFQPVDEMPKEGFGEVNYFGYEDDIMLEPGKEWLTRHKDQPFFATYLTIIPHHDYKLPDGYQPQDFAADPLYNFYLNAINYLDGFIERLIEQYKALGIYEDTIFVFVGDHGEGFGEHKRYQHDNLIYEEGIHIPLIIYDPSNPKNQQITAPVSQLDLLPALVDMLGFEILDAELPGFAFDQIPPDRQLFAKCWYQRRCIATIADQKKYLHHFHDQPDEFFDLRIDPLESENLAADHKELTNALYRELADWHTTVTGMYQRHTSKP